MSLQVFARSEFQPTIPDVVSVFCQRLPSFPTSTSSGCALILPEHPEADSILKRAVVHSIHLRCAVSVPDNRDDNVSATTRIHSMDFSAAVGRSLTPFAFHFLCHSS